MLSSVILIIDADAGRRSELQTILHFLDYENVVVSDNANWQAAVADSSIGAVLLGASRSADEALETFRALRSQFPQIPFIVLRGDALPYLPRDAEVGSYISVDAPVKYRQLAGALQQVLFFCVVCLFLFLLCLLVLF